MQKNSNSNSDTSYQADLTRHLKLLSSKSCWSIIGGSGTGSIISLSFGDKIRRKEPLQNPFISADAREFDAETSILIYCAWRIDSPNEVLCSSQSSNQEGETMLYELQKLVGNCVDEVDIQPPGHDLAIKFQNGLTLRVFCDITEEGSNSDNYVLYDSDEIFVVAAKSKITCEQRVCVIVKTCSDVQLAMAVVSVVCPM